MTVKRGPRTLVLLHLSDIHLRKAEILSPQDLDADIRERLAIDIARCELPANSKIDAILVTGDIAFGSKDVEYTNARQWLLTLCSRIGCPESQIWVVPGNHDIDRDVLAKNVTVRDMHSMIRNDADPAQALTDRLREDVGAHALLSPFAEFNRFAEQFGCDTTSSSVYWESDDDEDDLTLNDGSHLRLRGINSAIISDKAGDNGPPTEVVGLKQVQLRGNVEGICYLTLCHHPADWLLDGDVVQDHLISRARIQLFGHKHRQRARRIDNSLILGAGALHPNRKEDAWNPRYNILRLEVRGNHGDRRLRAEVYQRGWKAADAHFGKEMDSDGAYPKVFELPLDPWSPPALNAAQVQAADSHVQKHQEAKPAMMSNRELVFHFFALSYPDRMRILINLKLLDDADTGIADSTLIRRAIQRAKERDQLSQLEAVIRSSTPKE